MNMNKLFVVACAGFCLLSSVSDTGAQGTVSGVQMTYETFEMSPEGAVEILATGRIYLTNRTDGRYRIDRERQRAGVRENTTEIHTSDQQRITINHDLQIALSGPRAATWEVPSRIPRVTVPAAVDRGGRVYRAEPTGATIAIGPAILAEWASAPGTDGTRLVSWIDQESQKAVAMEIRYPNGSVSGDRITSAARVQFSPDTFAIPVGYGSQSLLDRRERTR